MDQFKHLRDNVSAPARSAEALSPSSQQALPRIPKAIFVGQGGDIQLRCIDDATAVVLRNISSGTIIPLRVAQIFPELTTADDLVGLY